MSLQHSTKLNDHLLIRQHEPYGFLLWLGLANSGLIFISLFVFCYLRIETLTAHFIILPDTFWLSTLLIIFSSILLHEANLAFYQERFLHYRIFLGATLLLGLLFIMLQVLGWMKMMGTDLDLNASSSFTYVYILSGLHFLHALCGVIFLGILFRKSLINRTYIDAFIYSVNPPNKLKMKLFTRYWHFVDITWVVVFLFIVLVFQ
jgi:cytochrome c oxidase subunit 3